MSFGGECRVGAKARADAFETRCGVGTVQGLEGHLPLAPLSVPAGGVAKLTSLVLVADQFGPAAGKVNFVPADETGNARVEIFARPADIGHEYRNAARLRLEHDIPCGVGAAGKH